MGFLIFVGILIALWFFGWLFSRLSDLRDKAKKYVELKARVGNLAIYKGKLDSEAQTLKVRKVVLERLLKEKTQGFPWLAQVYADYIHLEDLKEADYLQRKSHPAPVAAEKVREIAGRRRVAEKLYRMLKYQLEYYEKHS